MTENQPQVDDQVDQQPEADSESKSGFALYDNTLLRFTGPVRKTKAEAGKDKAKAPKGHDVTVRSV